MKFFLSFFILFSFLCAGCNGNLKHTFYENISEIQRDVFVGKYGEISATLILGQRESEYIKNGYSTDKIDFAVLSIEGIEIDNNEEYSYKLFVDENVYEGDLVHNPFGGLIVDIGRVETENVMVVSILGGDGVDIVLRSIVDEVSVKAVDAIDTVLDKNYKAISKLKQKGVFMAESYVKLMGTMDIHAEDLCWCITIIRRGGERFSYVVSAHSGEIISVQNNLG